MKTPFSFVAYALVLLMVLPLDACGPKDPEPETGFEVTAETTDGKPVPSVQVKWVYLDTNLPQENGSRSTDSNGRVREIGRKAGKYRFSVNVAGYRPATQDETVSSGQVAPISIKLEWQPLEINPATITFGSNETAKSMTFKNNSQNAITLTIKVPQTDDWLTITPATVTIPPNSQESVAVTVNSRGRGYGSYNSTVILNYSFAGNSGTGNFNVYMNLANPAAPTVVTKDVQGITQTSANIFGSVVTVGSGPVTDRGVCWSEASDPKPNDSPKKSVGAGNVGDFSETATGLKSNTIYYARAYATNANGTGLGEVRQFRTSSVATPPALTLDEVLDKNIAQTSAVVSARITDTGGGNITRKGFCWNTSGNPTIADNPVAAGDAGNALSSNLSNLVQGTTYYVRAFAENDKQTGTGYSNQVTFRTQVPTVAAKLTTGGATNITEAAARLQGNITELGSSPIVQHGFCWSRTNATPEVTNSDRNQLGGKLEAGTFNSNITNLRKGTLYYYRTYVTTADGRTVYGNTQTFFTPEQGLIVYYPFNGDASDLTSNGNNAVASARLTSDKPGNTQSAYDLSSGWVQMQNETIGRFVGDFTYSFWTKINSSAFKGSQKVLLSKGPHNRCYGDQYWSGFMIYTNPSTNSLNLFVDGADWKQADVKLFDGASIADDLS